MSTRNVRGGRQVLVAIQVLFAFGILAILAGCGTSPAEHDEHDEHADHAEPGEHGEHAEHDEATWSVTVWGERFEVFPEIGFLVEGEPAMAHTHVTRLADFSPLVEGTVEIVLVGSSGEEVFSADQPDRPGIFGIEIMPRAAGEVDVLFRIRAGEGVEEIAGGRVSIGTAKNPGGLLRAPAPRGATDGGEPLEFLKEQQWKTDFETAWVRDGLLARSVSGLATIRPPAGGERLITAPIDGIVRASAGAQAWPFVGARFGRGAPLFRIVPLAAPERSLASLEAEVASLASELGTARARRARLEELLVLDATSRRDVEEAQTRVATLEAHHEASSRDLDLARASREGGASNGGITLKAPFAGEIAAVETTPGATLTAGDRLARLVRTDVAWIEVALPPAAAGQIAAEGIRGLVLDDSEAVPTRIDEDLRLISVAPELTPRTGTVSVLIEAPRVDGLVLGATFAAQVLSAAERQGIVIPTSAIVDDGGVSVVYLQLAGESFVRQEVTVVERQGDRVLVEGLTPGQRLVSHGGEAIRRSSLMASGAGHGHVH